MKNVFLENKTKIFFVSVVVLTLVFGYQIHGSGSGGVIQYSSIESIVSEEKQSIDVVPNESAQSKSPQTEIRLLFGGDMMFDRHIRNMANVHGGYDFLFEPISEKLQKYDRVIANLEGPITSQNSKSAGSKIGEANNYVFTFDQASVKSLYNNNIRMVNIGNNHIMNFGKEGLDETEKFLEEGNLDFFGNPLNSDKQVKYENIHGIDIAFVSYNQFVSGGYDFALQNIKDAKNSSDIVIVYTHWGIEYDTHSSESIQKKAHDFIDAGADVIIGSHPHVIQESEEYKGKKIYYSLGNFIFDQYFSDETKQGLLVEMDIDTKSKQLSFHEIPVTLQTNGQVKFE